jgi:hypothetical protein
MARFYYQLEQLQAGGRFNAGSQQQLLFTGPHKRRLILFITDFYEHGNEIMKLLESFAAMGHEIIAFHLAGNQERTGQYKGFQAVEDLETGEVLQLDGQANTSAIAAAWLQFTNGISERLMQKNIHYRMLSLQEPMDAALRDFLLQRNKMRR